MARLASLVDQIKSIQRSGGKQDWWDYADAHLGGVKDPNRHNERDLEKFLAMYNGGGEPPRAARGAPKGGGRGPAGGGSSNAYVGGYGGSPQQAYMGGGRGAVGSYPPTKSGFANGSAFGRGPSAAPSPMMGGGGGAFNRGPAADYAPPMPMGGGPLDLTSFIKLGQKTSQNWKQAWQAYCMSQGCSTFDPARHDEDFIIGFVDYVGQCVEAQLGSPEDNGKGGYGSYGGGYGGGYAQEAPSQGKKRPRGEGGKGGGGAKRPANGGAGDENDAVKTELVNRVKSFQRRDAESKQTWWTFTDENHGGVHDPARHPIEVLSEFLETYE